MKLIKKCLAKIILHCNCIDHIPIKYTLAKFGEAIKHELIFSWHVIAMKCDCFIIPFEPAVTSESNYFGNGCRLLGRKPL